jgi:hypothetical protein
MVARRPIDRLAILTASVASIVIIINAAFLQSGFRHGTDRPEGSVPKLQKSQEFLNSEGDACVVKLTAQWTGLRL